MKARIVELSNGRYRAEIRVEGNNWRQMGLPGLGNPFDAPELLLWQTIVATYNRPSEPPPTVVRVVYP